MTKNMPPLKSNDIKPSANKVDKTALYCTVTVILSMLLASIHPLDWGNYLLHQAGTLLFMGGLLFCYRYLNIRPLALILATGFVLTHILGARYLYSFVPYNKWSTVVFNVSINELFGWQRNMYDRLVHFSYGFLLFAFIYDAFESWLNRLAVIPIHSAVSKTGYHYFLIGLVLMFNLASSALYELFEWALAMNMSPEDAEAYNGQQGDIWDAHKDMMLAFMGAVLFIPLLSYIDKHSIISKLKY